MREAGHGGRGGADRWRGVLASAGARRALLFGADGLPLAQWLRDGRARVVKQGPHRTVYQVRLDGMDVHLKHYPVYDLRAWLRQLVRPSKARSEFEIAEQLAAHGVPTFVPLAVGERVTTLGTGESWLVTETLAATEPLNTFIETTLPRLDAARQTVLRQRLAVALGASQHGCTTPAYCTTTCTPATCCSAGATTRRSCSSSTCITFGCTHTLAGSAAALTW